MLQNVVPFGVWGGSARHDVHHRDGSVYYQKFFTYIDNLLGTVPSPQAAEHRTGALAAEAQVQTAGGACSCGRGHVID